MKSARDAGRMSTFALSAAAMLVGCDKESTELATKDIEADFTIDYDDGDPAKPETKIGVRLRESKDSATGPQGSVNLSGTDALSVTTDKNDDVAIPRVGAGDYEINLPTFAASVFTFHLKRAAGSSDGTVFTMPGPLAFTDSPAGKTVAPNATLHFAWSNPAPARDLVPAKLQVSASTYPCGGGGVTLAPKNELAFDDLGTFDVEVAKLYAVGAPASGDCVDIRIRRRVLGSADAAFDAASSVAGTRTDRVQVKIQ